MVSRSLRVTAMRALRKRTMAEALALSTSAAFMVTPGAIIAHLGALLEANGPRTNPFWTISTDFVI
jgi:hypothetical protein